jgi:hypothetical protein
MIYFATCLSARILLVPFTHRGEFHKTKDGGRKKRNEDASAEDGEDQDARKVCPGTGLATH